MFANKGIFVDNLFLPVIVMVNNSIDIHLAVIFVKQNRTLFYLDEHILSIKLNT